MNHIIITGNLGRDPEMKYTPDGTAVTKFSVASNRKWKDASGEQQERTTWFNVECWAGLAETTNQYLRSGSKVLVEGRMECDTYEKDGTTVYYWKLKANSVEFLDRKEQTENAGRNVPF